MSARRPAPSPPPDPVDVIVEQWRRVRPDLGTDAMATFGRLGRLGALAERAIEAVFAAHGLSIGEFDVLAALRRAGEPYEMNPTVLARLLMLSPAGMTSRIDRLERAGHVARRADPSDRRAVRIALTPAGRALVDAAVDDHVRNEEALLAPLTPRERQALDGAIRKLLAHLDPPTA